MLGFRGSLYLSSESSLGLVLALFLRGTGVSLMAQTSSQPRPWSQPVSHSTHNSADTVSTIYVFAIICSILQLKKLKLTENRWPLQSHSGNIFSVELEVEQGFPRLQNLPSKGRAFVPGNRDQRTQQMPPVRVLLWYNLNNPEAN